MKHLRSLSIQVWLAIVAGIFLGYVNPELGAPLKPLGDAFIKLITMLIGAIIFATVVSGLGGMGGLKAVGRGSKAAPIAAFGAMAFTIGKYGAGSLAGLMGCGYLICFLFIVVVLGVDRFMSEARATTNFIGNSVATLVVSNCNKSFDASAPEAKLVLK